MVVLFYVVKAGVREHISGGALPHITASPGFTPAHTRSVAPDKVKLGELWNEGFLCAITFIMYN